MRLTLLASFAATLLVPAAACADAPAADSEAPARLSWEIEDQKEPGNVQFELSHRSPGHSYSTSRPVPLDSLVGITPAQLSSASGAQVRFHMVREAGSFDCEGIVRRGRGTGDCSFVPDPAFAAGLARRGMGQATPYQLFSLAMGDVGLVYADELDRQHYARPSVQDLVDAGNHGAGMDYLRGMGALGYRVGTVEALIRMRDHGVSPEYVKEMVEAGLRDVPADMLVEMRDHGVSPSYIGELRGLGYRDLPIRELIGLRDHGVTVDYVRALAGHGLRGAPLADVINLRDHGVTADYVGELRSSGWDRLTTEEIVRLRDHGVASSFVRELRALGYGGLRVDEIVRLRDMGVTAAFIRDANSAGRRSPDELVRLRTGG